MGGGVLTPTNPSLLRYPTGGYLPVLLALQKLAIGGDLEL